jgi:enoyl-CoA hydratase
VDVVGTLAAFSAPPEADTLAPRGRLIERAFAGDTVEAILDDLDREGAGADDGAGFAKEQAAAIRTKSPTSLKIALEQMRRGSHLDFAECMRTEFRIVNRIVLGHDFYEGVRAAVLDKDNAPRWNPASLEEVAAVTIERHLQPLAPETEELPL